jgi:AcrR family transcriptional regulator
MKRPFKEIIMVDEDTQKGEKFAADAKERLLDVAEQIFADRGLDGASIRELTAGAHCNLAAVNYYFGDKEALYEEVFRRRLREMRERRLASIREVLARPKGAALEDIIRADAEAFLEPFADAGVSRRFLMLFTREMVEQRLPKRLFLDEMVIPIIGALEKAIRAICPYLTGEQARMGINSVIGQLVHTIHVKAMPGVEAEMFAGFDARRAVEHIVKFSAAGIRSYNPEAK